MGAQFTIDHYLVPRPRTLPPLLAGSTIQFTFQAFPSPPPPDPRSLKFMDFEELLPRRIVQNKLAPVVSVTCFFLVARERHDEF